MNKGLKIYISGKITGLCPKEAAALFKAKERELMHLGDVFNPIEECAFLPKNSTWETYMRHCVKHLADCDEIHMLPNWEDSRGAIIEHDLAHTLGIKIFYP